MIPAGKFAWLEGRECQAGAAVTLPPRFQWGCQIREIYANERFVDNGFRVCIIPHLNSSLSLLPIQL